MNVWNFIVMIVVGCLAGTIAARIVKGETFGLVPNALLGIAGAVVGTIIFNAVGISPGALIVRSIRQTFEVDLPGSFVSQVVAAFTGSVLILFVTGLVMRRRAK